MHRLAALRAAAPLTFRVLTAHIEAMSSSDPARPRPIIDLTARVSGALFAAQPAGLRKLFFTELWERFSYYGMRALLTLFMVAPIAEGGLALSTQDAARLYGNYTMAVYMLSIPGGFIADRILGARRSVLVGGWTIALGHYCLAYPSLATFYAGLVLIALGTGLFKPNISGLVGALYAPETTGGTRAFRSSTRGSISARSSRRSSRASWHKVRSSKAGWRRPGSIRPQVGTGVSRPQAWA